jgi:mRNA-degrading endonuclease YafQ of YafQ-DinJ toxin-antitoxin module
VFDLVSDSHFERRLRRFRRAHPELEDRLRRTFEDLRNDPFQPHLRLHSLTGGLEGRSAVRLTFAYRIVITLRPEESKILLLDIGSHDEMY